MTGKLIIERAPGGWRDRYRAYEVIVNGELRGQLHHEDARTFEVEPGELEVYIKIDWCKSRVIRVKVNPKSELRLVCRPGRALTALYGITFGRNNYIKLEPA